MSENEISASTEQEVRDVGHKADAIDTAQKRTETTAQPESVAGSPVDSSVPAGELSHLAALEDAAVSPDLHRVREFVRASKAQNTLRGYRVDWREFCAWCSCHGAAALPAVPDAVAAYLADCAGRLKPGSLQRRLNAIAEAHKAAGLESPTSAGIVRNTLKGIRRTLGTAPIQKAPTLTADIRAMVDAVGAGLIATRDRALVLLGFAGAFRRSELVALDLADLEFSRDGLTVTLRRSKTDQEAAGRKVGIPFGANPETCPVRSLEAWIESASLVEGPLFRPIDRHGRVGVARLYGIDVARVIKKLAARAGLDPVKFAGHSLRAGHATAAAIAGASERSIMNQTGHRSVQMVRRYIRDGRLFRDNSAGKLGL
jgi:integrase